MKLYQRVAQTFKGLTSPTVDSSQYDPYWPSVVSRINFEQTTIQDLTGYPIVNNGVTFSAGGRFSTKKGTFGNGNTLNIDSSLVNFGSSDFSIEMSIWVPVGSSAVTLISRRNTSDYCPFSLVLQPSGQFQVLLSGNNVSWASTSAFGGYYTQRGTWIDVELQRRNGYVRLFVNGVLDPVTFYVPSFANSTNPAYIGNEPNGTSLFYADEIRISSGIARHVNNYTPVALPIQGLVNATYDPYVDNVVLLLRGDGTDGSTTIVDAKGRALTNLNSKVKLNASKATIGSACMEFTAADSSVLQFADSADWYANSDFTYEARVGLKSLTTQSGPSYSSNVGGYTSSTGKGWALTVGGSSTSVVTAVSLEIVDSAGAVYDYISASIPNWVGALAPMPHLALTRRKNFYALFVNGVRLSTKTITNEAAAGGQGCQFQIGKTNWAGYSRLLDGYLDEVRFTKGVCRYSSNFDVWTTAFPLSKTPA